MISITDIARFRQQVIQYSLKKGVTTASIRYKYSRKSIYKRLKVYDGTWRACKTKAADLKADAQNSIHNILLNG